MKAKLALALFLIALPFTAQASAPDVLVKVSCLLADQTTGQVIGIKDLELEEKQLDVQVFENKDGLVYKVGRTTAGSGKYSIQHLLFVSIEREGETIAQTGVDFTPGVAFNVMLTASPLKETITCAGK